MKDLSYDDYYDLSYDDYCDLSYDDYCNLDILTRKRQSLIERRGSLQDVYDGAHEAWGVRNPALIDTLSRLSGSIEAVELQIKDILDSYKSDRGK